MRKIFSDIFHDIKLPYECYFYCLHISFIIHYIFIYYIYRINSILCRLYACMCCWNTKWLKIIHDINLDTLAFHSLSVIFLYFTSVYFTRMYHQKPAPGNTYLVKYILMVLMLQEFHLRGKSRCNVEVYHRLLSNCQCVALSLLPC